MANKLAKVVITLDGKRVEYGLDQIRQKVKDLTGEMNKMANEGKQNTKAFKERVKAVNKLHKAEQDVVDVTKRISQYMKDLGNVATTDLRRAYREGIQLREGFKGTDAQLKQLNADLAAMKMQIDKNTGSTTAMAKAQQGFAGALGTTLKNLVAYMGVFAAFNKAKSMFGEFVDKNKEFSDQLANVRKVSNLAMNDIDKLAVSLSKIDSRTSLKGLMELSYTGAKLGFGNYGIEGLESFAKSAVKVQNALSEDMGADSMTALSKMVEVMGLIPKMGVERAMDATGSAIFKLASTSTATGTNIVEFSKRLMGLANIAHITTPELLAIGSAADSMALMPEVAATAFNKLITAVQKQPNLIEDALKIDKGTISDLFQAGKMTDALVLIFEKMREKGGMNALMQSGVFKDLGSDGARLVAVMATMANRVDMLNAHLAVSRQAFEEGTAVAQEYAIQMDTAAAYSERAANIWEKAFVNPEGVNVVRDLSKAWYEVSKSLTENEKIMFGIRVSLQGIILLLKTILTILPEIIFTLGISGMAAMIARMREGEGLLASLTAWFGKLSTAQKVFFKAAGWVGLAITILEVGKAIYDMANKTKEATIYMKGFNDSLSDLNTELGKSEAELKRYRRAIDEANVGSKQRLAAINTFNSKFSPYLKNLLTEKSTAKDVADAYEAINKAMRAKLALQLKEKDINEQVLPREQWTAERRTEYDKRAREAGYGQYGSTWITGYAQDNAAKSIDAMIRDIGKRFYNLPNVIIDEVAKQAKAGNTDFNNYGNIINSRYLGAANALLGANAYLRQDRAAQNALRRVNQKYKPEQDLIDSYTAANQQQDIIEPLTPAPEKGDKNTGKAKEIREKYTAAKEQAQGVIAKIDELYNLQEAAVKDAQALGQMTDKEAADLVKIMEIARNESLMRARKAVGSGDDEAIREWEQWAKTQMPKLIADSSQWSTELYDAIINVNIKDLYDFLKTFDGNNIAKIDSKAFLDSILKKGAENKKKSAVIAAQFRERTDQFLRQYEVIDTAQKKMRDDMQALGIMTETAEQMARRIAEGKDKQPKTLANGKTITDEAAYTQMGLKFVGQGTIPYTINIENDQEALAWIQQFAMTAKGELEDWAQAFPDIEQWVSLLQRKAELQKEGKDLSQAELDMLQAAIPTIRAMFYQLDMTANQMADTINKQVQQMTGRKPIGISEMQQQHDAQINLTTQLYDNQISEARESGNEDAAVELEERKKQALIDLEYKYQNELYQIREQMGVTWGEQYDHEVAMYQNMLDRKLISEKDFEKKKKELQAKNIIQYGQYYTQQVTSLVDAMRDYEIASTEAKYDAQIKAARNAGQDTAAIEEDKEREIMDIRKKYAVMELALKISEIIANTAVAMMTAAAQLGAFAGPAQAIIAATGALQVATAIAEYQKVMNASVAGSGSSSTGSSSSKNTRVVSRMLTYDEGNIGTYQGTDGKSYRATAVSNPADGLVTQPIATTVQGQPALVAERGPEIVLGRRTTRAIMMNEPGLIRYLANYGKNGPARRTFDDGNIDDLGMQLPDGAQPAQAGITADDARTLVAAIGMFNKTVTQMQQKGIPCYINKYGEGGLIDEVKSGMKFDAKYNRS